MIRAAGIMLLAPNGTVLVLRRGPGGDHPGEWCFPGGQCEGVETANEAAERVTLEESGSAPYEGLALWTRRISGDVDYTTFIARVNDQFVPELNGENVAFMWARPADLLAEELPRADTEPLPSDLPPSARIQHYDILPGREAEAGYFEADGDFGRGDGSGQIAVARRLRIGGEYRTLAEPGRVIMHEVGHAIDHAAGAPSTRMHLPAPGERETAWEAVGARYYLADANEFFAEAYATQHGPPDAMYFGGMTRDRAMQLYPGEIRAVVEAVEQWRHSSA